MSESGLDQELLERAAALVPRLTFGAVVEVRAPAPAEIPLCRSTSPANASQVSTVNGWIECTSVAMRRS